MLASKTNFLSFASCSASVLASCRAGLVHRVLWPRGHKAAVVNKDLLIL